MLEELPCWTESGVDAVMDCMLLVVGTMWASMAVVPFLQLLCENINWIILLLAHRFHCFA
jgi:cytochrome c oxidase assembly protein Cox11